VHRWVFSINSYRQRAPARETIGEMTNELGLPLVTFTVLCAFLSNLFFRERLPRDCVEHMLELFHVGRRSAGPTGRNEQAARKFPKPALRQRLRRALSELMVMNPEFRRDTTRLFLTMFGRSRRIEKELAADPLELLENDERALRATLRLVSVLARD
jgi:hypothetical protein